MDDPRRPVTLAYGVPGPRRDPFIGGAQSRQPVVRSPAEESREPGGPWLRSDLENLSPRSAEKKRQPRGPRSGC